MAEFVRRIPLFIKKLVYIPDNRIVEGFTRSDVCGALVVAAIAAPAHNITINLNK
jgi:hypothetical protein